MKEAWQLAACAIVLCAAGVLRAQTATATLQGQVTDPTGALIVEARVSVENVRTGVRLDSTTNDQGRYLVPFLQPGDYRLSVEKQGFQRFVRSGIKLDVQQNLLLDMGLALGDVSAAVEVTGATPPLATANATVSTTIDNRRVVDLPLNSRNVLTLALITPTAFLPNSSSGAQQDQWTAALGGGRNASSAVLVDGASINVSDATGGMSPLGMQPPSVDAVEEFTVQVNALSAEYGRTGGGLIQVATKQGTNQFHGNLREFLRNSAMDANNFFGNRAGAPLRSFKRHQYGFSLGGPVSVPKLYNGRNRTFFFADYELMRMRTLSPFTGTMPLDKWKQGDFSGLRHSSGATITLFDPLTTRPDDRGAYTRDAFAGNLIPASRIDPVARNVAGFFPSPNTRSANAFAEVNNYYIAGTGADDGQNLTIRLDHNPASAWRSYLRLNWADRYVNQPDYLGNKATNGADFDTQRYGAVWDNVITLSPSTILDVRYSVSRFHRTRSPLSKGFNPSALGFPSYLAQFAAAELLVFPQFGVSAIGGGTALKFVPTTHNYVTTMTRIQGRHTFKSGIEYRKIFLNYWQNNNASGTFSYGSGWTQRDPARSSTTEGFGFASLLLGLGSGSQLRSPAVAMASNYYGLYFQDDYRMTNRLTLNLGVRYEVDTPRTERYNRMSHFDVTAPSPIAGQVRGMPDLRGVMRFAGEKNRRQTPTDWNNIGPRFGFAYQVDAKTVLRGGYALMYDGSVMQVAYHNAGLAGFRATTNMITSLDGRIPLNYLRNPFPDGYLEPDGPRPGPTSGANTLLGQAITDGWFIDYVNPVIQQWNFNFQRELPGRLVVEAGYLANKGNHLIDGESNQYNQLTANYLSLGDSLNNLVDNPFYGVIQDSTSALSQPRVQMRQLLRPLPQYTGLSPNLMPMANSIYHSFTLRVEKRMSSLVGLLLAYTGGKAMSDAEGNNFFNEGGSSTRQDVYNRRADRSVSTQDVASRLVLSASFEVPFGVGRPFLSGSHPAVDALVGGWQINSLVTLQSGLPVVMFQSFNNTGLGNSAQRPNNNGQSARISGGTKDERLNRWFNPEVFSVAPAFTFGNAPRVLPDVRHPGVRNFDLSLFKTFQVVRERLRAQFRAEAFNAFNTAQFGRANSTIGAPAAGSIGAVAIAPREIQLALKLIF